MTGLLGLTAIVTGGASGIGAATVALLRERGAGGRAQIAQWQVPVPESVKVSPATGRKSQR
jgi:NADP-dependent 3-hydroxy acid dehydrogenase YdfG